MNEIPSLLKQDSFASYLKTYFGLIRNQFGSEVLKTAAFRVGITSRITFKHFIQGRKKPTDRQQAALENELDLGHTERMAINNLPMSAAEAEPAFFVSEEFLSNPLNTILLNVCALKKLQTAETIISAFKSIFSETDIRNSMNQLLDLKLVRKNADGGLERIFSGSLTTIPGIKSLASRKYFKHTYELAENSWQTPLYKRELNAFSIRMNDQDVPKMKDLIRKLREDLSSLSKSENCNSIYQISLAAFPIYSEEPEK